MNQTNAVSRFGAVAAVMASLSIAAAAADTKRDTQDLERLVMTYARSIDSADTNLAEQIFSSAPDVSFIHPRGEERGRAQIQAVVYRDLMGGLFSERKLTPKAISVHVYGDTAWSEFNWDFVAKLKKDGSAFRSRGRETQVYRREGGRWRIMHVHYSGAPAGVNP
jgi:ketosteroid isomerase-like protein